MAATVVTERAARRAWPPLLHRVVKTIRSRGLVERGQHILVALSGGPDSVALLSLCHRLRSSWSLTVTAVHFNYGLRGSESDADQEFVEALCRELQIPLSIKQVDLRARKPRTSLQAAARDLRYRAMEVLAEESRADRIAVGHTADDQAETVLLWMLRGAGLTGLSGMPACRDGKFIRPLYETRRKDILAYLRHAGLSFRQDSSNVKPIYMRNRIRQEVMPVLERLAPSGVTTLCRLADLCREDDRYLDEHVADLCSAEIRREADGSWSVQRTFVRQLPVALQRRLVRNMLRRCDPLHRPARARAVEQILQPVTARGRIREVLCKSTRVLIGPDRIRCYPSGARSRVQVPLQLPAPIVLPVPGRVTWAGTGQTIQVEQRARNRVRDFDQGNHCIVVDAERVSLPLVVRSWRPGDRFYPRGMRGRSKKLQDYFVDRKVSITDRGQVPVVEAPEGIVWVVGYRQDERWTPTEATKHCLVMSVNEKVTREGV